MTLSVTQHVEYEGISSASFAAMQAIAATNTKYTGLLSTYPIQKYTRAGYDGTDWFTGDQGQTRFNRYYLSHTGVITNYDRKILFAYQAGSSGIGFPTAETNIFNDTDGIGFVENSYTYVTNSQFPSFEISAGVATSVVQSVGDTSLSSADYGTDPSTLWSSGFYRVFYGWRMKNINRYIRFDTGTNGFQYINAP